GPGCSGGRRTTTMSGDAFADGSARPVPPERPEGAEPAPPQLPPVARARRLRCPHCHNPIELIEEDTSDEVFCPGCGSSFRLSSEPRLTTGFDESRQLGKFCLYERVGQGGFGAVWRARDTELERIVALKVPYAGQFDSPSQVERFHREARAA